MKTRRKSDVHPWVHALTCPLPRGTGYSELRELQGHLLEYLRHLPQNFALDDKERDEEIQRATDRLKKISRMIVVAPQTTTKLPPQNVSATRPSARTA